MENRAFAENQAESVWQGIWEEIKNVRSKYDVAVKIAIVGFGKSGKSTLFNTIFGKTLQETGAQTDLTGAEREESLFGTIFTDTRGFGTKRVSVSEIKGLLHDQNLIIHCMNGMSAISQDDSDLYQFCRESGKPVIVVVTKADVMKPREIEEFDKSLKDKISACAESIFISAETGFNLRLLIRKIVDLLPDIARDAFIAKQQADFEIKRKKCRALIQGTAIAAAGIAVSPIPVSDVIILVPMQAGMVVSIAKLYGYEITENMAKEILVVAGGGVVLRYAFQVIVKFIPILGSVIGPAIAYGGTVAIGEAGIVYFESGMSASPDEIAAAYRRAKEKAEREFKSNGMDEKMREKEQHLRDLGDKLQAGEIEQEDFRTLSTRLLECAGN
jgi:small GTP-binding protein